MASENLKKLGSFTMLIENILFLFYLLFYLLCYLLCYFISKRTCLNVK